MGAPWVFRGGKFVWKHRKKVRKHGKKAWKKGKSGAKWTYTKAKRTGQWAGTRVIGEWQKRQPDPMRPWTYRRMLGVPETLEMVQRGPKGYYDYKMRQYETAKDIYKYYKKSRGGGSTQLPHRTGSPWAPKSRLSSKRKSGQYIRRRRMTKGDSGIRRGARTPTTLPYRKGGCPPGYRYDRRRKMCVRK